MLLRPHGASIDVHVRVDFDRGHFEARGLEEQARGGGYKVGLNTWTGDGKRGSRVAHR